MWNGRWSKELDSLYEMYCSMFASEPDCEIDMNFDSLSYNEYSALLKKCILKGVSFRDILNR
jgi:hypothetical protein